MVSKHRPKFRNSSFQELVHMIKSFWKSLMVSFERIAVLLAALRGPQLALDLNHFIHSKPTKRERGCVAGLNSTRTV